MARVKTVTDPSKLVGAEKIEAYGSNILYCYGSDKGGKHELVAIIEKTKGGYIVDAEIDVVALIPSAMPTTENPNPLYDTYVRAFGRRALHVGVQILEDYYFGHMIISSELSSTTWEQIRRREYRIAEPE